MTGIGKGDTRRLLIEAAARLISASPGQDVPLRAICDAVGVKLPTLYHFFGSKDGLLDAVVEHGFDAYLGVKAEADTGGDPIEDLRAGWDAHVAFGLANAGFYALMYGKVVPHYRPAAAERPYLRLLRVCARAHAEHRLTVEVSQAADEVLAANVGVTLFLITAETPDLGLSVRMREATIESITSAGASVGSDDRPRLARELLRRLPTNGVPLEPEETALLRVWLAKIADRP